MIRKVVAGTVIAGALGVGGMALAGTASADAQNWTPGKGGWQPGAGLATFSANVKVANGNLNGVLADSKILSGNLSGNNITLKVPVLNGALSNNILNSGADSFNTTIKDSYNKIISDGNKFWPKKH
jgi:hypothetical protein